VNGEALAHWGLSRQKANKFSHLATKPAASYCSSTGIRFDSVPSIKRRFCAVINTVNSVCLMDGLLFPNKVSSKCPGIMFAGKRTASVPGRISLYRLCAA